MTTLFLNVCMCICVYVWSNHFCEGFVLYRRHADYCNKPILVFQNKQKKKHICSFNEQRNLTYISLYFNVDSQLCMTANIVECVVAFFVSCLGSHKAYSIKWWEDKKNNFLHEYAVTHSKSVLSLKGKLYFSTLKVGEYMCWENNW